MRKGSISTTSTRLSGLFLDKKCNKCNGEKYHKSGVSQNCECFNRNQYPIRLWDGREDRLLFSVGGSLVFSQYLDDKVLQEY